MNNYESLTPKQKEVLKLYALGNNRKQIAKKLFISPTTVHSHIADILNKLCIDKKEKASIIFWQNNIEKLKSISIEELM